MLNIEAVLRGYLVAKQLNTQAEEYDVLHFYQPLGKDKSVVVYNCENRKIKDSY